jgi:hypothetical protein
VYAREMGEKYDIRAGRIRRDGGESRHRGNRLDALGAGVELEEGLERMPSGVDRRLLLWRGGVIAAGVGEAEGEEGRVVGERHCLVDDSGRHEQGAGDNDGDDERGLCGRSRREIGRGDLYLKDVVRADGAASRRVSLRVVARRRP